MNECNDCKYLSRNIRFDLFGVVLDMGDWYCSKYNTYLSLATKCKKCLDAERSREHIKQYRKYN